jgi:hypothetical protein
MANLAALQAQIAQLQAQASGANVIPLVPNTPQPNLSIADIQAMVKTAIGTELSDVRKMLESLISGKAEEPKVVPKKELTILEAIGLALTPEEQTWLSKPEILKSLPTFLATSEGMECTKLFITELRKKNGN